MRVGVAEIAAVKNHATIQQRFATLAARLQIREQLREQLHVFAINFFELRKLLRDSSRGAKGCDSRHRSAVLRP